VALCDPELNPRGRLVSMFDMTGASYANMDVAAMRMILVSGWMHAPVKAFSPAVAQCCGLQCAADGCGCKHTSLLRHCSCRHLPYANAPSHTACDCLDPLSTKADWQTGKTWESGSTLGWQ
jgi:hypothetical protein